MCRGLREKEFFGFSRIGLTVNTDSVEQCGFDVSVCGPWLCDDNGIVQILMQ